MAPVCFSSYSSRCFLLMTEWMYSVLCVCVYVLDLHEGAPGGQPAGVHHARPATL